MECVICGAEIPEGTQVCYSCRVKNEGKAFESLMKSKDIQFEINDAVEQAFRQGYEEGNRQLESKYWDSQRLIDQYAAENKRMKFLLRELLQGQKQNCSDCDVEILSTACKARTNGNTCFKSKYFDEVMELINE